MVSPGLVANEVSKFLLPVDCLARPDFVFVFRSKYRVHLADKLDSLNHCCQIGIREARLAGEIVEINIRPDQRVSGAQGDSANSILCVRFENHPRESITVSFEE